MRTRLAALTFFIFLLITGCSYNEAKKVTQGGQGGQTASTSTSTTTTSQGGSGGDAGGQGGVAGSTSTAGSGGETGTGGQGGEAGSGGVKACNPGDQQHCTTSCDSIGLRGCSVYGVWSGCVPPYEVCNGEDDDCNDGVDENDVCDNECVDTGNECIWGGYGCAYAPEVYCIWEPDGPGGDPALVFQCLCPDSLGKGTWQAPGVICEEIPLCWNDI
ncbi:MAG: hypothetical protein ABIB04_02440 [Patescibacteria group bacterium]